MSMMLFSGPTLSKKDIDAHWQGLDYELYPPVRQGDIYLACQQHPQAIGIIDGYFERVPSVWHKEILWAMDQGIHVFGAASMGALRAAELSVYGMQGVGKIFTDFQSGALEDDDEVTIIHGPEEEGYESYSEAMVNIRATLQAAEQSGVIDSVCRHNLLSFSKQLHYSERSYERVLCAEHRSGKPLINDPQVMEKLKCFINTHGINQKREDALELVRLMAKRYRQGLTHSQTNFVFQYTDNWQQMLDQVERRQNTAVEEKTAPENSKPEGLASDNPVVQLRAKLSGKSKNEYQQISNAARFRRMAIQESYRQGVKVTTQMLSEAKHRFCLENDFILDKDIDFDAIQNWLYRQQLTMAQFDQLLRDQARFYWYCSLTESAEINEVIDYLKISGEYHSLVAG
ncbi:FIG029924: hypothetical protein [hydrothermal vent metagenome]|uniref:TfuA-like core domain-containing protein n=1 Tax=hydrothermal vent metagenome TaxID=652676 RepID=A0A3B0X0N3_9ZZZZ